jgi:murein DD-endopeptidase MepM/ murein hydrolase activator NlpD
MENILGTITWAHLSSRVKIGQAIVKGHVIAEVGVTGYTLLPHIHFQVFTLELISGWILIQ